MNKNRNKLLFTFNFKILYTFLLLFFFNIYVFGKDTTDVFNEYADKINLIITKALLIEKGEDVSKFDVELPYEKFKELIPKGLKKNRELAKEINEIKEKIKYKYSSNEILKALMEFSDMSIEKIPKKKSDEKGEKREKTLNKIRSEIENVLSGLFSKFVSAEKKNNIPTIPEDEEETAEANIEYYIIFIAIYLVILSVFTLIRLLFLIKDYNHLKKKFNDLTNEMKENDRKVNNVNNEFSNFKALMEKRMNELENKLENKFDQVNNFNQIQVHKENSDCEQTPPIKEPIIKFIESPEREGYFSKKFLTNIDEGKAIYKIIFYPDSDRIEYDILTDKINIHRKAMDRSDIVLKPACDYGNEPSPNDTKICKFDDKLGTIYEENDKLIIKDKIKINFR